MSKETEMACEILQRTNDGDDLSPSDLYLTECAVNKFLTKEGVAAFEELHKQVVDGKYIKPWYHDIEHMTQDHHGYIYWKGVEVEHFSHDTYEEAHPDALQLAERCKNLEAHGIVPTCGTAVWYYEKLAANNFQKGCMSE